jgi:DNA-binding MurR/RpiR family transcriptional regulator
MAARTQRQPRTPRATKTVAELLRAGRGDLTPAELRVAQAVLADYPAAGLQTVAALAAAAGVSPPTVVRLVSKLGFTGFATLQKRLRAELSARSVGPVELYPEPEPGTAPSPLLRRCQRTIGHAVTQSLRELDPVELDRAVQLIVDRDRGVVLTGGRVSSTHAEYLGRYLALLRPAVRYLQPDRATRDAALLDVDRQTTVVVFDYRRYDDEVVEFGREAARRGAKVVLFTDPYLSPLASAATVLLTTVVDGPRPFLTLAPALAVVESLVLGVVEASGPRLRRRLESFDRLTERDPR